jgi:FkbM family methyltransferase
MLKTLLFRTFGRRRVQRWIAQLKGTRPVFSEADLILDYFSVFPRAGACMADVGVHFGESCEPYLEMGWKVLGFEPDPRNRSQIKAHTRLKLLPLAVSNQNDQTVTLYASEESSGISSLSAFRESHRPIATVKTTTLATALAAEKMERVDFLKIDIEGHDLFALQGFPFDRIQPEVVTCEFEDYKTVPLGYTYQQLGDFLAEKGYTVWLSEWSPIIRYGTAHEWKDIRPFPSKLTDARGWGNFVAVRTQHAERFEQVVKKYVRQVRGE